MQPWIWINIKEVNIQDLKGKSFVIKHKGKELTYHGYVFEAIDVKESKEDSCVCVFSNEDFWVFIYPEDEVMWLL